MKNKIICFKFAGKRVIGKVVGYRRTVDVINNMSVALYDIAAFLNIEDIETGDKYVAFENNAGKVGCFTKVIGEWKDDLH